MHFCNDSILKKFRMLIRLDSPELFFNKVMALDDITCEKQCLDQVKQLVDLIEKEIWPKHVEFDQLV